MEFFLLFSGFLGTLRETPKIFFKNGKLMASITLTTLVLYSLIYLPNIFSIKLLTRYLLKKEQLVLLSTPASPEFNTILFHLKQDLGIFIEVQWTYLIISSVFSLFLSTVTIFGSAVIHEGKGSISFKNLLLKSLKSWKRPLVTWFYTTLLGSGFFCLFSLIVLPLALIVQTSTFYVFLILLAIPASILYVHMSVVWTLALVISVLEEICGNEAIGKAAQIVKGMKIHGFLLNLIFTAIFSILAEGMRWIGIPEAMTSFKLIFGCILIISISCLVMIVRLVAYTLFYFQCKKTHGEEVELQVNVGYSKLATNASLLIGENVP
ncbi:hypothetical protein JCGZ_07820 [Jatropha curcas]|uniref:Transmembrane protein n=2 Tax=Jatropha curcas TaxID=180498 RepID=A0A067KR26_JATCU|nr:hypothetical protein JCGZ_07820 [Jatropha curcas]